jgi:hypothetical protein
MNDIKIGIILFIDELEAIYRLTFLQLYFGSMLPSFGVLGERESIFRIFEESSHGIKTIRIRLLY